jgi:hypothetical protein
VNPFELPLTVADRATRERAVARAREARVRLPTFDEIADPFAARLPAREDADPDRPDPANLLRVHWHNGPDRRAPVPVPGFIELPSSLTGGPPATARWGSGPAFVVEADEYAGNFDPYRPTVAILTSAEWDHPDVFADRPAVIDTFEGWLRRAPAGATLIANVADEGVAAVVERLALVGHVRDQRRGDAPGNTGARDQDRASIQNENTSLPGKGYRACND